LDPRTHCARGLLQVEARSLRGGGYTVRSFSGIASASHLETSISKSTTSNRAAPVGHRVAADGSNTGRPDRTYALRR
jgi:hypothetical protein